MQIAKWIVIALMSVAMAFSTHQYMAFLVVTHHWKGIEVGDWPTWIGAIGTVCTLIGTIVLATTETRHRRSETFAIARLTAAKMFHQLLVNESNSRAALSSIELSLIAQHPFYDPIEFPRGMGFHAIQCLETVVDWPIDQLLAIASLPKDCAVRLAAAHGKVGATTKMLHQMQNETNADYIRKYLEAQKAALESAIIDMQTVIDVFGKTVDVATTI